MCPSNANTPRHDQHVRAAAVPGGGELPQGLAAFAAAASRTSAVSKGAGSDRLGLLRSLTRALSVDNALRRELCRLLPPCPWCPVPAPSAAPLPTLRQHDALRGSVFAPLSPHAPDHWLTSLFTCYSTEQITKGLPETP